MNRLLGNHFLNLVTADFFFLDLDREKARKRRKISISIDQIKTSPLIIFIAVEKVNSDLNFRVFFRAAKMTETHLISRIFFFCEFLEILLSYILKKRFFSSFGLSLQTGLKIDRIFRALELNEK